MAKSFSAYIPTISSTSAYFHLVFKDPADYELLARGDEFSTTGLRTLIMEANEIPVTIAGKNICSLLLYQRQRPFFSREDYLIPGNDLAHDHTKQTAHQAGTTEQSFYETILFVSLTEERAVAPVAGCLISGTYHEKTFPVPGKALRGRPDASLRRFP